MSNSTITFDPVVQSQASKEVTVNAFFDACSQASTYGRRQSTSSGLTFGYYGGNVTLSGGALSQIANGSVLLTASSTNYLVVLKSTGVVSVSTSNTNWNDTANYWRLYSIAAGAATVTSYVDSREMGKFQGGGGAAGTVDLATVTGNLDVSHLGSGTAATAASYWCGDGTWKTPAGSGDMALASIQTVTAAKTFANATFLLRNVAATFSAGFTNTITANRTYTLPDASGTIALITDISVIPQNIQSAAYTLVLSDAGKHIFHPVADTTARTYTINSNANVAYPIGTALTFINQYGAGVVTIAITTDTMRLAGGALTGSRTLAAGGLATAIKVTSTEWIISGTGLA